MPGLRLLTGRNTRLAQTFRGTILGTVTDPTGALVAGATVKVRNTGTGLERTVTTTSADGSYSIPELPIGTYSVTVTQTGFQTFGHERVSKSTWPPSAASTRSSRPARYQPGRRSLRRRRFRRSKPPPTNSGGVLTSQTVEDLPVNGRDYTKLIFLNPGVAGSPDQITDSPGSFGEFSMNGARGRSNNYLLDGTDMNDGYRNDPAINQGGVLRSRPPFFPSAPSPK